jgi:hypothetical protein
LFPFPKISAFRFSQISELKLQIDTLSCEVDLRTPSFDSLIAVARQIVAQKLDDLETEYQPRVNSLCEQHTSEESALEQELKDIEQSFDDRLRQETQIEIREGNRIQRRI